MAATFLFNETYASKRRVAHPHTCASYLRGLIANPRHSPGHRVCSSVHSAQKVFSDHLQVANASAYPSIFLRRIDNQERLQTQYITELVALCSRIREPQQFLSLVFLQDWHAD